MKSKDIFLRFSHSVVSTIILSITLSCTHQEQNGTNLITNTAGDCSNYLPLAIGNYWEYSSNSYTKITDTVSINGHLYYVLASLVGGDMVNTEYLRLDENRNLIGILPSSKKTYTKAKFNSNVGGTFRNWSENIDSYRIKTIHKSDDSIRFRWTLLNHINLEGTTHTETYICGIGFKSRKAKIGGKTFILK